ncbi:MAG: radical SAM protein [Dissulfurispiraceae bacterium]
MHNKESKDTNATSGIMCLQPFYFMEFTTSGKVYTCCPSWIKSSIGNIKDKTIAEIWNSEEAQYIRKKMYRGEWQDICNPICPHLSVFRHDNNLFLYDYIDALEVLTPQLSDEIKGGKIHLQSSPTIFNLSNSKICNLSCIMCDRLTQVDDRELIEKTAKDIFTHLSSAKKLVLSGLGDPFARPDTRYLLINFKDENSELKFDLITNGLLLPKYWEQIKHQKFDALLISIDAATKGTYEKIRIGGSWETLLQSLSLIKENRDKFNTVTLNMTVMRHNYREILEFIVFAESYGFNASFQRIRGDWGDQNFFDMQDSRAIEELRKIIMHEKSKERNINIFWGDLLEFMGKESKKS